MRISAAQCRAARGLLNISQAELAERALISKQSLSLFEVGRTNPTRASMKAIVGVLTGDGIKFIDEYDGMPADGVVLVRAA
jgi:transcriptional regulator with XRE-family HTH domain